jgi:hypothetical protein
VSCDFYKVICKIPNYAIQKEEYFIKKSYPYVCDMPGGLIEACGGFKKLGELPFLDMSKKHTRDHIDYIQASDLTSPIMKGTDEVGRPFVTFKLKGHPRAVTIFKRYTDIKEDWRTAPGSIMSDHFGNSSGVKNQNFDNIKLLFETGQFFGESYFTNGTFTVFLDI